MRITRILCCSCVLLFANAAMAQVARFDSAANMGDAGYRVTCNNKNIDENKVSVSTKGFKSGVRPVQFTIKGTLRGMAVDDLNDDGFPDLVLFFYGGIDQQTGSIMCISSKENTSVVPIYFPDIYNDPKLREGYKGYDKFSTVIGLLQRSFPLYKAGDTDKPTGGTRTILYKIMNEQGSPLFKVLRTYDSP